MYLEGDKPIGQAKVFRCKYCKDGEVTIDGYQKLKQQADMLYEALKEARKYLIQGKQMFAPNTTNSLVDDFIRDDKALKNYESFIKEGNNGTR